MNIFLLIFFLIIGIAGFVYQVNAGVFIGFSLIPWQVIRLKYSKKLNLIAILITAVTGSIYFIYLKGSWKLFVLFLFVELYNYWGHRKIEIDTHLTK